MFLLRDKLITQGEKREASTQNLERNNVARRVKGFCISYFAALRTMPTFVTRSAHHARQYGSSTMGALG